MSDGFGFGSSRVKNSSGMGFASRARNSGGKKAKPKKPHGVMGFVENLVGDVRDSVVGIPTGLIATAKDPIKSVKIMGATTWHDWSPLFEGDVQEFGRRFYDHPLGPILDVASFATLGAGSVAKGASLAGKAGVKSARVAKVAEAGRAKTISIKGRDVGTTGPTVHRSFDANPLSRKRQEVGRAFGHALGEAMPKFFGRYAPKNEYERLLVKQVKKRQSATKAALQLQMATFVKAGKDLTTNTQDVGRRIETHGAEQLQAHAFRVKGRDLVKTKKGFAAPDGFTFVNKAPKMGFKGTTPEQFRTYMETFAGRHTTTRTANAVRDANGDFLIVPKHDAARWGKEAIESSKFVELIYNKPTRFWKYMVLAARPAYFVNNAVGNTAMYGMAMGGEGAVRGLVDAWRQVHGEAKTARAMQGAERELRKMHGDWQDHWYLGLHKGISQDVMEQTFQIKGKNLPDRVVKTVNVAGNGLYPVTHKWTDVFLRRAGINALLRKNPEVQKLMEQGWDFNDAAEVVSRDPAVRSAVQQRLEDALGEYHYLNKTERQIRQLVPFYTWDRAILRHGVKLTLGKPGRVSAASKVGELGSDVTKAALGEIPEWLQGAVPLDYFGIGGEAEGKRETILSTYGLNPYGSIAELADTAKALTAGDVRAGEHISGQINPLATKAIEHITGQSLLSGAKIDRGRGGLIPDVIERSTTDLPQLKLISTLLNGAPEPKRNKRTGKRTPFLFEKDFEEKLGQFLGLPVRQMDRKRAADMKQRDLKAIY